MPRVGSDWNRSAAAADRSIPACSRLFLWQILDQTASLVDDPPGFRPADQGLEPKRRHFAARQAFGEPVDPCNLWYLAGYRRVRSRPVGSGSYPDGGFRFHLVAPR